MEVKYKLDRCDFNNQMLEIFVEFLSDVLLSFGIDYYDDLDHRDRGSLVSSLKSMGFEVLYYPKVCGFKILNENTIVGEFCEIEKVLKKDNISFYYEITFEVWNDLEESIYTGEE